MLTELDPNLVHLYYQPPHTTLFIQAALPHFLHTLPKLLTIEGQGSGWQGPSPLAPPEEPKHA